MELTKIVDKLGLKVAAGGENLNKEVQSGYVSDLLSDVMANAHAGALWITIQIHANIVAVITLNDLAGVVIANGKPPAEDTLAKARAEGVAILTTPLSSYEFAGQLYKLGIRGIAP